jgi:lipopolysaccharide cholinephosphotransferase
MDQLLTRHKIRYFVESGTLLGAIRNNGPILYDDDADISIFAEDVEKFLALEKDINELGYKLIIKYPDWYVITSKEVSLDVFHIKKMGSIYRYANDSARLSWSRFFFYEDELFPLKRHRCLVP